MMLRISNFYQRHRGGPLSRIVMLVLIAVIAVFALTFGLVLAVILLAGALLFFSFLYLRTWWLRRRLGLNVHPSHAHNQRQGETLEGEYTVDRPDKDDRGGNIH